MEGKAADALALLDQALARDPDLLPAAINRVAALSETGRAEEARALGETLLQSHPDQPELLLNTANALLQLARGREAARLLKKALAVKPDFPAARYLLAMLVGDEHELSAVIDYMEARLAREGEQRGLLVALANAHQAAGHLAAAGHYAARLKVLEPDHPAARLTLASIASNSGHTDFLDAFYGELFATAPAQMFGLASNWLFKGNYLPQLAPEALFACQRRYAERYEPALIVREAHHHPPPLKFGYLSGDLCRHPVGELLAAIIARHDRSAITPIAFSTTLREDELTLALKRHFAAWHEVFDLDDEALVALLAKEGIDILVDLAGHTAFHGLPVFARRAAPVQVTWIGYFHSTGLANIDYLLTDPYTSPPELGQHFSETPILLGPTRFCFTPPPYAPPVAPAPTQRGLPFTFGSFNRLAKINDEALDVWSEILHRAPHARLWLKAGSLRDAWVRADLRARFAARGIAAERLILSPAGAHRLMLEEFAMVDLCLDPFPFTGGATSLEAFWIGTPTLTVPGATMVSRQTHAMLVNLGLDHLFSASGARDYIERAVAFAHQPQQLWPIRAQLRQRMVESPLCDAPTFTRRLEHFYCCAYAAATAGTRLPPYWVADAP